MPPAAATAAPATCPPEPFPVLGVSLLPYARNMNRCRSPYRVMRATHDVIKDHGDIYGTTFTRFLFSFLAMKDAEKVRELRLRRGLE